MSRNRSTTVFITLLSTLTIAAGFLATTANAEVSCGFTTQRVQCGDLGCDKERGVCIACRSTADCYPNGMQCNVNSGECEVRSFFSLFGWRTVISMIGAFAICSVAVIAGVGGGGMLVPMFTGLMQLPMQSSVGLSQSTICGQSTLNMYLAVQKKYPDASWDRPLINYQYLSLLLPLGLIGTLIGGILSKLCPDLLRLLLLFALLSAVLYRTVVKMKAQYAEDKEAKRVTIESPNDPHNSGYGSATNEVSAKRSEHAGAAQNGDAAQSGDAPQGGDAAATKPALAQYPKFELGMSFAAFFTLLFFGICRTFCSCGGALYWLCIITPLLLLAAAFYYCREHLRHLSESEPENLTFPWNEKSSVVYPLVAVVAGAAAAMLGIGGGLVLGFVLYEVGLVPEEASVTGGMATFFIAFSSALQLLVTGQLVVDCGIVFFIVGMGSTALGQFVFMKYIKEHGLRYLIVGALAFVVGGSLLVLGGYGIFNAVNSSRNGGSVMAFGRLCTR